MIGVGAGVRNWIRVMTHDSESAGEDVNDSDVIGTLTYSLLDSKSESPINSESSASDGPTSRPRRQGGARATVTALSQQGCGGQT